MLREILQECGMKESKKEWLTIYNTTVRPKNTKTEEKYTGVTNLEATKALSRSSLDEMT